MNDLANLGSRASLAGRMVGHACAWKEKLLKMAVKGSTRTNYIPEDHYWTTPKCYD